MEVFVDNSVLNSDIVVWGDIDIFNFCWFDNEILNMCKSLCCFGIGLWRCMGYWVVDIFMKVLLVILLINYIVILEINVIGDDGSVLV